MKNQLKYFRKEKGFTQFELAARSNVSLSYISLIERGLNCSKQIKVKIANALQLEPSVIFNQENLRNS